MTEPALSMLDQAHAHRLDGNEDAALRLAIACARAAPDAPGPVALLARILVDGERVLPISEIAARLVDAFVRRGDLPGAVVASNIGLDGGAPQRPLLRIIAEAFAKGSPRGAEGSLRPPPFPHVEASEDRLSVVPEGDAIGVAEALLRAYVDAEDPLPADAPLPKLALFGALEPRDLEQLLSAARVEEVSRGHEVVRQGDPGNEAFVLARGRLKVVRRQGADETQLAQLGPGALFGEMALLSDGPRSASVFASEPAQLLVLARDELEQAAADAPELSAQLSAYCRRRMQLNLVRHARVLSGLSPAQRGELLEQLPSRMFEPGERLIARDQEADRIFLLASGAVSISIPEDGERLVLATLGPGEVVGEMSLILRRPASADVVAQYPTLAYELSLADLGKLMRAYPPLLVELYDLATRRDEEFRATPQDEPLDAGDVLI